MKIVKKYWWLVLSCIVVLFAIDYSNTTKCDNVAIYQKCRNYIN